ncbi:MAG: hypothetical protein ACYC6B_03755 [Thermoleophilia bacterium]
MGERGESAVGFTKIMGVLSELVPVTDQQISQNGNGHRQEEQQDLGGRQPGSATGDKN